ncbi:hypothetical protein GCM10008107_27650 [Psychrosphaera saromensis]|uniref:KfrA N-terminal DNA-binding domain-containing protein n=1 Tax=Psychrosphaera saromensis TaxID=716813 RepID=A0A2S7UXS9_9GAMM|nr:hypothetical protein [Psychrosphaera saromensis]PQJ54070.1 hypothetical protein BTO11_10685 [Psychrosphaera saromensis]GHB76601.1 hypothetical protein GCM10008107_27650 [Psychrosphaera saromensis]GLQ14432.1 hypothetical protein GCM10007917_18870 [Psychrosphaera saromensis]
MNTAEIIRICQTLSQQGKEPSIALIKSRADKGTPMPTVISGLQQWRANPSLDIPLDETTKVTNDEKQTLEQRVQTLEQEVAELKASLLRLIA